MSLHVRHFVENCVSLQSVREEKWCLLQVCLRKLIFHTFLSLSHTHDAHTSTSSFKYILYISENIVHTTRLTLKSCVEYSCVVP